MANTVDREIRISATDTGVADRISKIKEGALALGRGIAEDAKKQATSSRELIKLMNEEIVAIEKRNKLNKEERELSARQKPGNTGVMGKTQLGKDLDKISIESKEDKIQTDLLKQILQGILKTSSAEISVDRESVKKQISSDKEIDTMEDHEEALKQTFQKQMLKDTEPGKVKGPDGVERTISTIGAFTRPGDLYSIGAGGMESIMHSKANRVENNLARNSLLAGGFAFGIAGMGISAANEFFEGSDALSRVTGEHHPHGFDDIGKGLDFSKGQAMRRAAGLITSSVGTITDPGEMRRMLGVERAYGANVDLVAQTSKFSQDASGMQIVGGAKMVMTDKDTQLHRSRLQELLQLQLEMTEKQFMASGEGSAQGNMAIIHKIMSGQIINSPGRARKTLGELDNLVQGGSEDLEALRFSEFQKKNGGTYFDYLREKELGATGEIDDLMINKVLSGPGSEYDKQMSLYHMGLQPGSIDNIMRVGGVTPEIKERLLRESQAVGVGMSNESLEGGVGINPIALSSAGVTDKIAAMGEAAVLATERLIKLGSGDDVTEIKRVLSEIMSKYNLGVYVPGKSNEKTE